MKFVIVAIFAVCLVDAEDIRAQRDQTGVCGELAGRIAAADTAELVRRGSISFDVSSAIIRHDLRLNAVQLANLDIFFRQVVSDPLLSVARIRLTGSSSVEGGVELNDRLSRNRALAFRDFLETHYRLSIHLPVELYDIGEDWNGLDEQVERLRADEFPWRDEALRVIRGGTSPNQREQALRRLAGGKPYRYLEQHIFPLQRRVRFAVMYDRATPLAIPFSPLPAIHFPSYKLEKKLIQVNKIVQDKDTNSFYADTNTKSHLRLAIKSNMFLLAGLTTEVRFVAVTPNLEVEYMFNRRLALAVAWTYKPFRWASGYDTWKATAYTVEGRYRPLPLRDGYGGLYIGIYGRGGDYNIRPERERVDGNTTGKYYEGGASLGYTLPLSRHWLLEGSIAGGFRHTRIHGYSHEGERLNYRDYTRHTNRVRLTDIALRIGYRFKL
ncbi:MAG: DUF3575 domain-containing protein [Mediterranea sp.]|nr:DUF3575 domain-containing protein [Mediterranea sp.]